MCANKRLYTKRVYTLWSYYLLPYPFSIFLSLFVKRRYTRYSSVSNMLDGVAASFSKETGGSTNSV